MERWRLRRPADRAAAQRAKVTAVALLAVTAGLAVLLAILFHLDVAAVVVAILSTLPTLYLAYLAVHGAIIPPEPARCRSWSLAAWWSSGIRWIWACAR